jgi:2'-5' RNA ligase
VGRRSRLLGTRTTLVRAGVFTLAELTGGIGEQVRAIQRLHDPKLALGRAPHITITGSSGIGPIDPATPVAELQRVLTPITDTTAPITVHFGLPHRFMQTNIVVLPIDPHGPIRTLFQRIAASGLPHERARFPFTPHCTLNFYATLTPAKLATLCAIRIPELFVIDRIQLHYTREPQPSRKLLELKLRG